MPQLDKVTFLSQFFWLCLLYLGFYYLVLKYFLPKISRILTLRQKKRNFSQYGCNFLQQENQKVREKLDNNLYRGFSLSRYVLNDLIYRSSNWLNESITSVNKTHYKTANQSYIDYLGKDCLSQKIKLYQASIVSPQDFKVWKIVDDVKKLRKKLISISQKKTEQNPTISLKQDVTVQENTKKSRKNKKNIK